MRLVAATGRGELACMAAGFMHRLVVGVPRRHLGGQVVLEVALHGLAAARLHGRDLNGLQVIIERDGISNVNHDNVRVLRELDREALALIVVELGLRNPVTNPRKTRDFGGPKSELGPKARVRENFRIRSSEEG